MPRKLSIQFQYRIRMCRECIVHLVSGQLCRGDEGLYLFRLLRCVPVRQICPCPSPDTRNNRPAVRALSRKKMAADIVASFIAGSSRPPPFAGTLKSSPARHCPNSLSTSVSVTPAACYKTIIWVSPRSVRKQVLTTYPISTGNSKPSRDGHLWNTSGNLPLAWEQ